MSELDDTDREFLRQYTADKTPSVLAKERAWESLSARLGVAPSAGSAKPASTAGLRLLKGLGLATLLVGPIVGGGALAGSERATAEVVPTVRPEKAELARERVVARPDPAPAHDELLPTDVDVDQSPPPTEPRALEIPRQGRHGPSTRSARKAPASAPRSSSSPNPTVPNVSTLQAELALIRRGQTALRDGEPARALRAFDQHALEFPQGILAEERMVKRIAALCKLGHKERARTAATQFLATHGTSPLASHARRVCDEGDTP